MISHTWLHQVLHEYGYGAVGALVGLESMGVPLPGEGALIAASVYAATTGRLDIVGIVLAAAAGACIGNAVGYAIGWTLGHRALVRYGWRIGLTERRVLLGHYLFARHGGKVVFFGRFVVLLRTIAALLAGANQMPWQRFLAFTVASAVTWALIYGFGAYTLGHAMKRVAGPAGIALAVLGAASLFLAWRFVRRNEERLMREAERSEESRRALHPV